MNNFHKIPDNLKRLARWLLWRAEQRNGKLTKVPCRADGTRASSTDPSTWMAFEQAAAVFERGGFSGIGFVFNGDGIIGVDLDHAIDDAGKLEPWAAGIVRRLDSYTEVSPSGRGLHVIVRAAMPAGGNRRGAVEIYASGRYFTMTGNRWEGTPPTMESRDAELAEVHAEHVAWPAARKERKTREGLPKATAEEAGGFDDDALLDKARAAKNGDKFDALMRGDWTGYGSQSDADLALSGLLAFWTKRDGQRIDRLFRRSRLMRAKWDEPHHSNGQTYGAWTIDMALKACRETYGAGKRGAGGEAVDAASVMKQIEDVLGSDMGDVEKAKQACGLAAKLEGLHRSAAINKIKQATHLLKPDIKAEIDRIAEKQRPCSGRAMGDIAMAYMKERLAPRFIVRDRDSEIWCEACGCRMRQAEFCSMLESELLERIKPADDYAEPTRTDPTKPIKQLQQVLRAVWADLVRELPEETGETILGPESKAATAFRLVIEGLWSAPETWMKFNEKGQADDKGEHVERMSLASRVRELVRLRECDRPAWARVLKGVNAFYRVENGQVWLGMRYDLCRGEIKGHRIESIKSQSDLSLLMKRYGLANGTGAVTDRLREDDKQRRLMVLSRALCDLLVDSADPEDGEALSHDEPQVSVPGGCVDSRRMPWDEDSPAEGKSVAQ